MSGRGVRDRGLKPWEPVFSRDLRYGSVTVGNTPGVLPVTVTINVGTGQPDPTDAEPIIFDVVFSEPVTGFATGDVSLSGTAGATTAVVVNSGDDVNYTVEVTGMIQTGDVTASIPAGVATSIATGVANSASFSVDNTVQFFGGVYIRSWNSNSDSAAGTSITVNFPGDAVAGDYAIFIGMYGTISPGPAGSTTPPSGWRFLGAANYGVAFGKLLDSSDIMAGSVTHSGFVSTGDRRAMVTIVAGVQSQFPLMNFGVSANGTTDVSAGGPTNGSRLTYPDGVAIRTGMRVSTNAITQTDMTYDETFNQAIAGGMSGSARIYGYEKDNGSSLTSINNVFATSTGSILSFTVTAVFTHRDVVNTPGPYLVGIDSALAGNPSSPVSIARGSVSPAAVLEPNDLILVIACGFGGVAPTSPAGTSILLGSTTGGYTMRAYWFLWTNETQFTATMSGDRYMSIYAVRRADTSSPVAGTCYEGRDGISHPVPVTAYDPAETVTATDALFISMGWVLGNNFGTASNMTVSPDRSFDVLLNDGDQTGGTDSCTAVGARRASGTVTEFGITWPAATTAAQCGMFALVS